MECGRDSGKTVRVEYADGREEILRLCGDCRQNFADGGFVEEIAPRESDGG
jgi:hypothetical protein